MALYNSRHVQVASCKLLSFLINTKSQNEWNKNLKGMERKSSQQDHPSLPRIFQGKNECKLSKTEIWWNTRWKTLSIDHSTRMISSFSGEAGRDKSKMHDNALKRHVRKKAEWVRNVSNALLPEFNQHALHKIKFHLFVGYARYFEIFPAHKTQWCLCWATLRENELPSSLCNYKEVRIIHQFFGVKIHRNSVHTLVAGTKTYTQEYFLRVGCRIYCHGLCHCSRPRFYQASYFT